MRCAYCDLQHVLRVTRGPLTAFNGAAWRGSRTVVSRLGCRSCQPSRVSLSTVRPVTRGTQFEMTDDDLKRKLILAGKILVAEGQDDFTRGHISVRLPHDPSRFFMKPHSVGLDELTMENILTIDLDGNVVAGTSRRHREVYIHSEIFKARADVQSVIHTHPPYSVALSASGRPLRCYGQPSALFFEALGVFCDTVALIRTPAMGKGVAAALGPHRAVLLKNHGVAVVGASIEEAVINVIMLETAAKVQMIVEAAGDPGPPFPRPSLHKFQP